MFRQMRYLPVSLFILLCACGSSTENPKDKDAASPGVAAEGNYLVMKINGREWKADQGIFAAFHPPGYNKAIVIAGSKGPKDKNEQAFSINLYNTGGPAVFTIKEGNPDFSVAQMANISPENFMYGSVMGFAMKITVTKASSNPTIVEAVFEGELTGNAGDKLVITEGKFYYRE